MGVEVVPWQKGVEWRGLPREPAGRRPQRSADNSFHSSVIPTYQVSNSRLRESEVDEVLAARLVEQRRVIKLQQAVLTQMYLYTLLIIM